MNLLRKVGKGTKIYQEELSNIRECEIGENCIIHSHVWIGDNVIIGNNVRIQAFSFIPEGVRIDDNVFIGPRVTFTNDKNPPSDKTRWQKTYVLEGARIGAGAIILPGVVIGENAMVGAGAVVTKDIPNGEVFVGNPAKELKR